MRHGRDERRICAAVRHARSHPAGLLAAGVLLLVQLVVLPNGARAEALLERLQHAGEIRLGYAGEAPYAYRAPDGRLTGEAIEVARRIFAEMGVTRVVGMQTEFGSLIHDLNAERFDVIAAGMFILPERCAQIAFSEPSFVVGQAFAVRPGNPKRLHAYEDVAGDPSLRLATVTGTAELDYGRALGIADSQMMVFPDAATAADGVISGRADAYAGTALTIQRLVVQRPTLLERAQPFRNPTIAGREVLGYGAFGFRLADAKLRDEFDRHLLMFRGTPEHLALVAPFGFTAAEMPERTTAEICSSP
jgi:polar amino acid transport system substrate-binding protein